MKPDCDHRITFSLSRRLLYFPAFIFIFSISYSQEISSGDSLRRKPESIYTLDVENLRLSLNHKQVLVASQLIPPLGSEDSRTLIFMDSLKTRASRTLMTRKLYDFVITSPGGAAPSKEIKNSSDASYHSYSGMKIRKIEIKRLSVFGTNIGNPDFYDPNKIENLLNKTHFNTNENIIRKNLLFSEGDTVIPLIVSDNERLIRDLPFIDDARILIIPVSDNEADVIVITKDVYSLGANFNFSGFDKVSLSVYEKNIFGMGHEFGIEIPYNSDISDVPGFGMNYKINNFRKTFVDFGTYYFNGLGKMTYGFDLTRKLVSATTKYAGGISVSEMYTTDDLDTMQVPAPLKYNLQDYWLLRSFLLNQVSVSRLIIGARYINNNVYSRPAIQPDSYHSLQKYKIFLGSVSFSVQKYHKAHLIYGYGRTEDIPYGGLINITVGRELNEFKKRYYIGSAISLGESIRGVGYFYTSAGFAAFYNEGNIEQGMLSLKTNFFSNLSYLGRYRMRNFLNIEYTRGLNRYSDEYLQFIRENGFSGFRNDSTGKAQRLSIGFESVLFSPANFYGFKFAIFGFADYGFLFGTHEYIGNGEVLSSLGIGVRIRNDNLIFNTLQIRLCFYPNLPDYSRINNLIISGEQLLKPDNFEPGRPSLLPFR